jgi:hypothetical protein
MEEDGCKAHTPAPIAKYGFYSAPEFIAVTAADQPIIEGGARKFRVSVIIEHGADGRDLDSKDFCAASLTGTTLSGYSGQYPERIFHIGIGLRS